MIKKIKFGENEFKISLPRLNDLGSTFSKVFGNEDIYRFDSEVRSILTKRDVIIDCGAHIGLFSLCVSQYVDRVYAFEPDIANCEYFRRNLELNDIKNVILSTKAVANIVGERDFLVSCKSPATSSFYEYPFFNDDGESSLTRKVECITLKDVFDENNIDFCSLVKMNIEGAEFEVLLNLPSDIYEKIEMFVIESHNRVTKYGEQDLIDKLKENGFETTILFRTGKDKTEFTEMRSIRKEIKQ